MLAVGWDKQLAEVACKTNGDGTTAPVVGAVTEISAALAELVSNAMLKNKSNKVPGNRDRKDFIYDSFQGSIPSPLCCRRAGWRVNFLDTLVWDFVAL